MALDPLWNDYKLTDFFFTLNPSLKLIAWLILSHWNGLQSLKDGMTESREGTQEKSAFNIFLLKFHVSVYLMGCDPDGLILP